MNNKNVFIIAEIAQAHDGSLGIAHSYIDALSKIGVNAIKFQTHIADAESSIYEPFRVNFSYEDKTRYDYWKRIEFTIEQWAGLKTHCDRNEVEFISSPFSNCAVDLLEKIGVKRYKVGSGEVNNFLLLKKISETKKPIIVSSGLSTLDELDSAISFLKPLNKEISILQCTSSYPTNPGEWGLKIIPKLIDRYNLDVGFSDHSGNIFPSIAAVAFGAKILEVHITFDKRMFGPDSSASLTIDEMEQLVINVRKLEIDLKTFEDKIITEKVVSMKNIFEKSLAVNKDLVNGSIIRFEDLESKKPKGFGIAANEYERVIGRTLNRNLKKYEFINDSDLL